MLEVTSALIADASKAVRFGEWPQRALVRFGVSGPTAAEWLSVGEQRAQEGVHEDDDLVRLFRALDQAEADCEGDWVNRMVAAASNGRQGVGPSRNGTPIRSDDWLKMLQARFPDRWRVSGAGRAPRGESMEETLKRIQAEK